MKKISYLYMLIIVTCYSLAGCNKKLDKINEDPNRPKTVTPGVLLGQLQYKFVNTSVARSRDFTNQVMQVMAPRSSSSGGLHRYDVTPSSNNSVWTNFYSYMTDVEDLLRIADSLKEKSYTAIALIYKTYGYSILTDCFGSIPYTQATKAASGLVQPAFDDQKSIYVSLLKNLDSANNLLEGSKLLTYGGDLVYPSANGATSNPGILKWKKFSNSLRLRLLLRVLKHDGEINARQQIEMILSNPAKYPVFLSNDDEAILRYPGVFPYFNPYYNARTSDWRYDNCYTKFFINKMNADEDPRRPIWATTVDGIYQGIESGYKADVVYVVDKNSSYSDALKTLPQAGVIMTYAEVEFIKAELALRGYTTGKTAKQHYEKGIEASMLQWGTTLPAGYTSKPGVLYNEAGNLEQQLEQIILQKYYALFYCDFQSWFEKRRTGYPILPRGNGIPAENQFPNRCPYPSYLQSLNPDNLKAAVTAMGGDKSTIKVWWENNTN